MSVSATFDSPFPPEMICSVAINAQRDAEAVCSFLGELGLRGRPDKPLSLPADFLLTLGAGLRLLAWEARGITIHRTAGLPAAMEVIRGAFRSLHNPSQKDPCLPVRVLGLSVERLSWHARLTLGADVLLDDLDSDSAAEAIAEFLWASRRSASHTSYDTPEN